MVRAGNLAAVSLGLVCFGSVRPRELDFLPSRLREVFGLEAHWVGCVPLPSSAYRRSRSQYIAYGLLEILNGISTDHFRLLGLTEVDIYAPGLNFVFGQSQLGGRCAVVSLARLRPTFYGFAPDEGIFISRTVKEAVHELGHTFMLPHCRHPLCVMHFSNCLSDTDRKGEDFCIRCRKNLNRRLQEFRGTE